MLLKVGILVLCTFAVGGEINKRKAKCSAKYQKIPNHSACLSPSSKVEDEGVTESEEEYIVKEHNRIRSEVDPPASNMQALSYDPDLAATAQAWASACTMAHDKGPERLSVGRFSVGQNLAYGNGKKSWDVAIGGWESEKNDFTYNTSTSAMVGHYTQQVWAETVKIGCGYAKCGEMHYYVCNYGPAGNMKPLQFTPWKKGDSCGDCPSKCSNKKLCDCGGMVCMNGGKPKLDECECECTESFFGGPLPFLKGDSCELDCSKIAKEQPSYCGPQFSKNQCSISTVTTHCPKMCGIC